VLRKNAYDDPSPNRGIAVVVVVVVVVEASATVIILVFKLAGQRRSVKGAPKPVTEAFHAGDDNEVRRV
jgi:hypothetical protein